MRKWPCLILPQYCKTEIHVKIEDEGLSEEGESIVVCEWKGHCNYQDKARKILTEQQKIVQVNGRCLIPGDIAPNCAVISSGTVHMFEVDREIVQGTKARNPDGSVNYTLLELV